MIPAAPPALIQAPSADAQAFEARCADFTKARDWKGLEAFARAYADAHPQDAPSRAALGYALMAQNRLPEGEAACKAALALDAKCREAYLYLGMQAAAAGDREGVLAWGRKLDEAIPGAGVPFFKSRGVFCALGTDPSVLCVELDQIKVRVQPPMPAYPEAAKAAGIQGSVVVDVAFGPDGTPTSAHALCGPMALRAYAENFALRWRYAPVQQGGRPVSVRWPLVIVMKLDLPHGNLMQNQILLKRSHGG